MDIEGLEVKDLGEDLTPATNATQNATLGELLETDIE